MPFHSFHAHDSTERIVVFGRPPVASPSSSPPLASPAPPASRSPSPPPLLSSTDKSPPAHHPPADVPSPAPRRRSDSRAARPAASSRSPSPPLLRSRPRSPPAVSNDTSSRPALSNDQRYQRSLDAKGIDFQAGKLRDEMAKERRLRRFNINLEDGPRRLQINGRLEDASKADQSSLKREKSYAIEQQSPQEIPLDQANDMEDLDMLAERDWLSGEAIIGSCPDMCPESERMEREKKGDLDKYERIDGDRNQTNKHLAVKKYTRTAEKDTFLIRPLPVLLMTMDHLLSLINKGYDNELLAVHNFLWDRMRAVRMDLRMQHVFDHQAIIMHEQMIRFHILAMHELCEFAKGEGFSEGFDSHLNIEQMNKASVDLFHMYNDLRKQGNPVKSEAEFRGYYALLKLDKHPGYKVEPAELSLDLAKMTPEIRKSPEIQFAREVARACRTGNFLVFFRLARGATYLQACLMHAHFSKLRTQAMASLYSGLQKNYGIPIAQVEEWLAMEGEDIEALAQYHGFSLKNYQEVYMVKEGPFINRDRDFRIRRAKLVELKQSSKVVDDVLFSVLKGDAWLQKQFTTSVLRRPPSFRRHSDSFPTPIPIPEEEMPDYEEEDQPLDDMEIIGEPSIHEERPFVEEKSETPAMPGLEFIQHCEESEHRDDLPETELEWQEIRLRKRRKMKEDTRWDAKLNEDMDSSFVGKDVSGEEETRRIINPETPAVIVPRGASHKEELAHFKAEADRERLQRCLRRWKLKATSKSEERHWLEGKARAALSSLVLGPPVQSHISASSTTHIRESGQQRLPLPIEASYLSSNMWDIANKRIHRFQGMWTNFDLPSIAAPIMQLHNPNARFICWKLLLYSGVHDPFSDSRNNRHSNRAGKWLTAKLNCNGYRQTGRGLHSVSVHTDVCQELVFVPGKKCGSKVLFCSIVRNVAFINNRIKNIEGNQGASGILFLVSEGKPLIEECTRFHLLVDTIPSGSALPLLILYTRLQRLHVNSEERSLTDTDCLAACLQLEGLDKSKIAFWAIFCILDNECNVNLADCQNIGGSRIVPENQGFQIASNDCAKGFFNDSILKDGLLWLVERAPLQLNMRCLHIKDLVVEHLEPSIRKLFAMKTSEVTPQTCVAFFNEALQRSEYEVQRAVCNSPASWPPAEVLSAQSEVLPWEDLQMFFPKPGWNKAENVKSILDILSLSQLSPFPLANLGKLDCNSNLRRQKSALEELLWQYISKLGGIKQDLSMSQILYSLLQKGCTIGWSDFGHVLVPNWAYIFQKIYQMRLMLLDTEPPLIVCIPSNQVHQQNYGVDSFRFPPVSWLNLHPASLTLDEAIELESSGMNCKPLGRRKSEENDMFYKSRAVCTRNATDGRVVYSSGYCQDRLNETWRASAGTKPIILEKLHSSNAASLLLGDWPSVMENKQMPGSTGLDDRVQNADICVEASADFEDLKALAHSNGPIKNVSTSLHFPTIQEEVREFCKRVDDQAAQAAMLESDKMVILTRSRTSRECSVDRASSDCQQATSSEPSFGVLLTQNPQLSSFFPPLLATGESTDPFTNLLNRCMSVQREIDKKLIDYFHDAT